MRTLIRIFFYTVIVAAIATFFLDEAKGQTAQQLRIIDHEANRYGLDPALLVAIAQHESAFDPNAKGALGEIGLFQLRPEFHPGTRAGDVRGNIHLAARYLALLRDICGPTYGPAWFLCFNRGPNAPVPADPKATDYYKRVTAYYAEATEALSASRQAAPYVQ